MTVAALQAIAAQAPPARPPSELDPEVERLIRQYGQARARLTSVGDPDLSSPAQVAAVVPEAGPVGQAVLLFLRGMGQVTAITFRDAAGEEIAGPIEEVVRGRAREDRDIEIVGPAGEARRVAVTEGEQVVRTTVPPNAVSGPIAVMSDQQTELSPRFEVTDAPPPVWRPEVLSGWDDRRREA